MKTNRLDVIGGGEGSPGGSPSISSGASNAQDSAANSPSRRGVNLLDEVVSHYYCETKIENYPMTNPKKQ